MLEQHWIPSPRGSKPLLPATALLSPKTVEAGERAGAVPSGDVSSNPSSVLSDGVTFLNSLPFSEPQWQEGQRPGSQPGSRRVRQQKAVERSCRFSCHPRACTPVSQRFLETHGALSAGTSLVGAGGGQRAFIKLWPPPPPASPGCMRIK